MGGEVSLMFANVTDIQPQMKSGKIRVLAVTVPKRSSLLPDVRRSPKRRCPGSRFARGSACSRRLQRRNRS